MCNYSTRRPHALIPSHAFLSYYFVCDCVRRHISLCTDHGVVNANNEPFIQPSSKETQVFELTFSQCSSYSMSDKWEGQCGENTSSCLTAVEVCFTFCVMLPVREHLHAIGLCSGQRLIVDHRGHSPSQISIMPPMRPHYADCSTVRDVELQIWHGRPGQCTRSN
jgi:hypothetical protein